MQNTAKFRILVIDKIALLIKAIVYGKKIKDSY